MYATDGTVFPEEVADGEAFDASGGDGAGFFEEHGVKDFPTDDEAFHGEVPAGEGVVQVVAAEVDDDVDVVWAAEDDFVDGRTGEGADFVEEAQVE